LGEEGRFLSVDSHKSLSREEEKMKDEEKQVFVCGKPEKREDL